jgi:fructose-bisphosphate aldolase/2-amino-3,7-dideoxy-D-threo-hept-6-ulosonate synthase
VVKSIPVPVVIAGGPKAKTDADVLQMTEDAMKAGAKGVTYGRNIFAHKNPEQIVDALAAIIFRKETAQEAAKRLGKK